MQQPSGKLIAIGGAEDKGTVPEKGELQKLSNLNFIELGILNRIVQESGGTAAKIEVITTASMIPNEVGENYLNAFGKIGCTDVSIMNIRNRADVVIPEFIERIRNCDAVMFSGGNQLRLSTIFGGTQLLQLMLQRYHNDAAFVVAGTSAGAMAMSNTMIYEGNATRAHLKGEVKITTGLGFMDDVVFDSHFEKRGRFNRLSQVVATNPSCLGIGLGEDTGMLITYGNKMEAIGSGCVIIIDGYDIRYSNIADVPDGSPFSIENLKVHVCEKGNGYLVNKRDFLSQATEGTIIKKQVEAE
ncbi:cyanophycinase [Ferruginibacter sp.]|uniref:cyanophycinase n=1 Tax=Ferruginibacter sp. TaxID=1940288 RepID=UPI0026594C6C|nr:cyanophycinase [Ferruginibacter sp.]